MRSDRPMFSSSDRKLDVEDVGVGAKRLGEAPEVAGVLEDVDCVTFALQDHAERPADVLFVVYDVDAFHGCQAAGRITRKAAPPSSPSISWISPPESSAPFRAIESPMPMPRLDRKSTRLNSSHL